MKRLNKEKIIEELIIVFWLFILGSFLGYIFEMIVVLFQKGYFESRQGLIYGPFIPVYGLGILLYYFVLNKINLKSKTKIFFVTMILGGLMEYLCSFIQEKVFGTISWDYSNLMFNINGRTSLLHCTYWGIAGILYSSFVCPLIIKLRENIKKNNKKVVTIVLSIFIIFDVSISCVAANRQTERRKNILPNSRLDIFLDTYYSDEFMDRIYANKREVF